MLKWKVSQTYVMLGFGLDVGTQSLKALFCGGFSRGLDVGFSQRRDVRWADWVTGWLAGWLEITRAVERLIF